MRKVAKSAVSNLLTEIRVPAGSRFSRALIFCCNLRTANFMLVPWLNETVIFAKSEKTRDSISWISSKVASSPSIGMTRSRSNFSGDAPAIPVLMKTSGKINCGSNCTDNRCHEITPSKQSPAVIMKMVMGRFRANAVIVF